MAANSITFVATTNRVTATRPQWIRHQPTKQVMEEHQAFKSAFASGEETFMDETSSGKVADATIIQCSSPTEKIVSCEAGLVSVVLGAYNGHHNLVLRPDDVWQAVLAQFNFYVKARAEQLRDKVVDFQGQKELTVRSYGNLYSANYAEMAVRMSDEIAGNIKDRHLVAWLLPSFTSTTPDDLVAASVTVMSTMQKYFKYRFELSCGIPSVTLLGTVEDWKKLRLKMDRLLEFEISGHTYMKEWHGWLAYIGDNLVASAQGSPDLKFWDRVASHYGGGSGPSYVSGWISAFSVWSEEGEWQGTKRTFESIWSGATSTSEFPIINTNDLTSGAVSVPVLVDDNGIEHDCLMFAGQFGMRVDGDTISPATDWCIATKTNEEKKGQD